MFSNYNQSCRSVSKKLLQVFQICTTPPLELTKTNKQTNKRSVVVVEGGEDDNLDGLDRGLKLNYIHGPHLDEKELAGRIRTQKALESHIKL